MYINLKSVQVLYEFYTRFPFGDRLRKYKNYRKNQYFVSFPEKKLFSVQFSILFREREQNNCFIDFLHLFVIYFQIETSFTILNTSQIFWLTCWLLDLRCLSNKINPLTANLTKWSNTFTQFVGNLPTNCLSMFDHFVELALKGLN